MTTPVSERLEGHRKAPWGVSGKAVHRFGWSVPAAAILCVLLISCSSEPECSTDAQCPPTYECVSAGGVFVSERVCLPEDREDEDAGTERNGDANTGEDTDLDANGESPPDDASETTDSSCGGGEFNCGGACVDIDSDDAHCGECGNSCAADETCESGNCNCAEACCDDSDCADWQICGDGTCVCDEANECCGDEDCPGFEECQSGSCMCDGGECCTDDDCSGGLMCSNRQECIDEGTYCDDSCDCPYGYLCSASNECAQLLPGPTPPPCCDDPTCDSGESCVESDGSSGTC